MSEITYNGESRKLIINTGALYRFEKSGFSFDDLENPHRMIQCQVALIGAALDPQTPLDEVADRMPALPLVTKAIGEALEESGITDLDEGTAEGNESAGGGNIEPSVSSSSASGRKTLRPAPQESSAS